MNYGLRDGSRIPARTARLSPLLKSPALPGLEICAKRQSPYWNKPRQRPIRPNANPVRNDRRMTHQTAQPADTERSS